jgi:hypothetical protein
MPIEGFNRRLIPAKSSVGCWRVSINGGRFMWQNVFLSRRSILAAMCLLLSAGCAGRTYLMVDYQLPPESEALRGQLVRLTVQDVRAETTILSSSAAKEFDNFKDHYSLAFVTATGERAFKGDQDLVNLFRSAFRKRLELLGVEVLEFAKADVPVFEIVIKELSIDLKDRKWLTKVGYEANLSSDSRIIARENITGEAERLKIIGRKGADTVFSDIFTEIINRVDIVKLFRQTKLI